MTSFLQATSDDGVATHSSSEQHQAEKMCREAYSEWLNPDGSLSRES